MWWDRKGENFSLKLRKGAIATKLWNNCVLEAIEIVIAQLWVDAAAVICTHEALHMYFVSNDSDTGQVVKADTS